MYQISCRFDELHGSDLPPPSSICVTFFKASRVEGVTLILNHCNYSFIILFLYRIYGFYDECKRRYNIKLWKTFTDCFNCLPIGMSFCFYFGISSSSKINVTFLSTGSRERGTKIVSGLCNLNAMQCNVM